jgi:hypothetical protein
MLSIRREFDRPNDHSSLHRLAPPPAAHPGGPGTAARPLGYAAAPLLRPAHTRRAASSSAAALRGHTGARSAGQPALWDGRRAAPSSAARRRGAKRRGAAAPRSAARRRVPGGRAPGYAAGHGRPPRRGSAAPLLRAVGSAATAARVIRTVAAGRGCRPPLRHRAPGPRPPALPRRGPARRVGGPVQRAPGPRAPAAPPRVFFRPRPRAAPSPLAMRARPGPARPARRPPAALPIRLECPPRRRTPPRRWGPDRPVRSNTHRVHDTAESARALLHFPLPWRRKSHFLLSRLLPWLELAFMSFRQWCLAPEFLPGPGGQSPGPGYYSSLN